MPVIVRSVCRAFENNINGKCKASEAGSEDREIRNSFMDVKMKKCYLCCYEQKLEWDRERRKVVAAVGRR